MHFEPCCCPPEVSSHLELFDHGCDLLAQPAVRRVVIVYETGGRVSVWEAAVPPGAGAPHHSHAGEDEAFYVLEGEVTVEAAGRERPIVLGAGGFVYSPRGVGHAFHNSGAGILRMLILCVPGGFERMFGEIDAVARSQRTPDVARLADLAARHGVSIAQSD